MREAAPGWARWLVLSAIVVVADLATKAWVSHALAYGDVVRVTSFFNIILTHNPGAAFSFLAGAGGWQRWFFTAVAVVISVALVIMLRRPHLDRRVPLALSLVLGGAVGNLWDRVTLGHVVDFIQLHAGGYYWPAFNVADSAITAGVALLIWDGVRGSGGKPGSAKETKEAKA
jgi:signal peptidase II